MIDQYKSLFEGMKAKGDLTELGVTTSGSKIEYRPASEADSRTLLGFGT